MSPLETTPEYLGREAYSAYARHTGGKTYDGRKMPTWQDLPPNIQDAWKSVALHIRNLERFFDGIPPL